MICTDRLENLGLEAGEAAKISGRVNALLDQANPSACWQKISQSVLKLDLPFEVHQYVHEVVFEHWDDAQGPRPVWVQSQSTIDRSNVGRLMRQQSISDYRQLHRWSVKDREEFWTLSIAALGLRFRRSPLCILAPDSSAEAPRWLPGAQLNIVESCFAADDEAPAIVFDTVDGGVGRQTYGELRTLVNRVSNGLGAAGVVPGDAIAIDMPMTAESVAIYLGIIQSGGVVVSIADSFAKPQIALRLGIAKAKVIFTMSHLRRGGRRLPLYAKIVAADPDGSVRAIVLNGADGNGVEVRDQDQRWSNFLSDNGHFEPYVASPEHPINVLFSSGTTGEPKAIPWDHTTAIRCAVDGYYHHDIHPDDVIAWPTNLGWMMGPWLIFAALINRGTVALFSDVPTGRAFGKFIQNAGVNMLGVVPSLVCQWRQSQCMEGLDWSSIRAFSSTGECSNPDDMFYLMYLARYQPVIEYCGGTEIGGGYITSTVVQPNAPSTFSTPALGSDFIILDDDNCPADTGELFLIPPSLGLSRRLLNQDHHKVYFDQVPAFPGDLGGQCLRRHGDQFQRLPGGYYRALGRADDTMNLGGVKVGSAQVERVLHQLDGVRETAAVAIAPPAGGPSLLVIFAVIDIDPVRPPEQWQTRMQQLIKSQLNPLFKIHEVQLVEALPRTASNKVMRRQLRATYQKSTRN